MRLCPRGTSEASFNLAGCHPACIDADLLPMSQVAEVTTDQLFRIECIDWTGGQIKDDDSAEDMKSIDLSCVRSPWTLCLSILCPCLLAGVDQSHHSRRPFAALCVVTGS